MSDSNSNVILANLCLAAASAGCLAKDNFSEPSFGCAAHALCFAESISELISKGLGDSYPEVENVRSLIGEMYNWGTGPLLGAEELSQLTPPIEKWQIAAIEFPIPGVVLADHAISSEEQMEKSFFEQYSWVPPAFSMAYAAYRKEDYPGFLSAILLALIQSDPSRYREPTRVLLMASVLVLTSLV